MKEEKGICENEKEKRENQAFMACKVILLFGIFLDF